MKRPRIITILVAALSLAATSGCMYEDKPALSPEAVKEVLYLSHTEDLDNGKIRYHLILGKWAVTDRSDPFVTGEQNAWTNGDLDNGADPNFWVTQVDAYDGQKVRFVYGGVWNDNPELAVWAQIQNSAYYWENPSDPSESGLVVGFHSGNIFTRSSTPPSITPPDTQGDQAFRVSYNEGVLAIYCSMHIVECESPSPFFMGTINDWIEEGLSFFDSSGWGSTEFEVDLPLTMRFSFGGDLSANCWADLAGSSYFDDNQKNIHIAIDRGGRLTLP